MDTEDLFNLELPINICIGIFFSLERWYLELELAKLLFLFLPIVAVWMCTCFTWFTLMVVIVLAMVWMDSSRTKVIWIHWLTVTVMWLHIAVAPTIRLFLLLIIITMP